jgi:hypothetical protein
MNNIWMEVLTLDSINSFNNNPELSEIECLNINPINLEKKELARVTLIGEVSLDLFVIISVVIGD